MKVLGNFAKSGREYIPVLEMFRNVPSTVCNPVFELVYAMTPVQRIPTDARVDRLWTQVRGLPPPKCYSCRKYYNLYPSEWLLEVYLDSLHNGKRKQDHSQSWPNIVEMFDMSDSFFTTNYGFWATCVFAQCEGVEGLPEISAKEYLLMGKMMAKIVRNLLLPLYVINPQMHRRNEEGKYLIQKRNATSLRTNSPSEKIFINNNLLPLRYALRERGVNGANSPLNDLSFGRDSCFYYLLMPFGVVCGLQNARPLVGARLQAICQYNDAYFGNLDYGPVQKKLYDQLFDEAPEKIKIDRNDKSKYEDDEEMIEMLLGQVSKNELMSLATGPGNGIYRWDYFWYEMRNRVLEMWFVLDPDSNEHAKDEMWKMVQNVNYYFQIEERFNKLKKWNRDQRDAKFGKPKFQKMLKKWKYKDDYLEQFNEANEFVIILGHKFTRKGGHEFMKRMNITNDRNRYVRDVWARAFDLFYMEGEEYPKNDVTLWPLLQNIWRMEAEDHLFPGKNEILGWDAENRHITMEMLEQEPQSVEIHMDQHNLSLTDLISEDLKGLYNETIRLCPEDKDAMEYIIESSLTLKEAFYKGLVDAVNANYEQSNRLKLEQFATPTV